ncbi:2-hydroxyhepta-2,4-diene-1,7-dioate isomerase, putative [Talaromyces stipitatus ATCC 10500]|uniref:Fumarylacetoacetase n=1 Tax=Talaromyces stipitatus (strain ATCC 10500 / CBS 375.48 / QM 6759 / NRRL 1006) TaxID=441959 RepID=B8MJB9_TALSN|nr:2-hydroxyhepta-2,4-diene-1,7-dioate isomerase, putative [Talaromyces stipitatus ATCC 10500]EED14708.1 2-hydroxyhepta-2,4-diene-1,7-dioate isomerase, putative [Talaromyces stipitatus ATCC 10500]
MSAFKYPVDIPIDSPFGLYNIPFGIYSTDSKTPRAATAVQNWIIDLDALLRYGIFKDEGYANLLQGVFLQPVLNEFAALPIAVRHHVRQSIIDNLSDPESLIFTDHTLQSEALLPIDEGKMHLPMRLTDYTDFYTSVVHAETAGKGLNVPIPPAFWEYPMAYNGRISSVTVSGTDVIRPKGFFLPPESSDGHVKLQPSQKLDFEMELGCFISHPVAPGHVVPAKDAWKHVFGYVLLNDWSARDTQRYEMHPFGPFHSKSFLTSVSPWVVTPEALQGSLISPVAANKLPIESHLQSDPNKHAGYDIEFSVFLSRNSFAPVKISRSYLRDSHWDSLQMIAYQSSSGCGLNTGDLLGSGTNSSPTPVVRDPLSPVGCGCLFEAVSAGIDLPPVAGQKVVWLEDGDRVIMEGWFTTPDGKRAGFGPLSHLVVPARM